MPDHYGVNVNCLHGFDVSAVKVRHAEGKGMTVQIGQGRMIAGFEEGLKGAKSGDDLTLNLTFPDNYQAEHLAGKPVEFAIHVNTVEAPNWVYPTVIWTRCGMRSGTTCSGNWRTRLKVA